MDWRSEASGSSDRSMLNLARGNAALPFASQRARQGRQALHRAPRRSASANGDSPERQAASIQGFIAHADAPRSIRHTARWRARQLRAASPFASRTSVQAHAHNHANGMTRRRDAPRSGDGRRANKQGATSSQCNATTQRNATQHRIALQAPSASLSTVERRGQHGPSLATRMLEI